MATDFVLALPTPPQGGSNFHRRSGRDFALVGVSSFPEEGELASRPRSFDITVIPVSVPTEEGGAAESREFIFSYFAFRLDSSNVPVRDIVAMRLPAWLFPCSLRFLLRMALKEVSVFPLFLHSLNS